MAKDALNILQQDFKSMFGHFSTLCMKRLKVVSATFGPIIMFKQQSLSFHVVSKTFITQNYLVLIPSKILRFSCLYDSGLAPSCTFSIKRNPKQTQF